MSNRLHVLCASVATVSQATYPATVPVTRKTWMTALMAAILLLALTPASFAQVITSISPNNGIQGQTVSVTIVGTSFVTAATTVSAAGPGISVSAVNVPNTTSLTATFTIAFNATAGGHAVTVTTQAGTSNAVTFTVNPSAGYTISALAGQSTVVEGGAATAQSLPPINDVARDSLGNLYLVATNGNKVYKVTPAGAISTFAGTGTPQNIGDGGPATSAQLSLPRSVVVDGNDNVYISTGSQVRKVTPAGIITNFAGTGLPTFSGDGGMAVLATLNGTAGLGIDGAGNLFIVDVNNSRIRKVDTGGRISTVAGNGSSGFNGDNQAATAASLSLISTTTKLAVDTAGNLYIPDSNNNRLRKVDTSGTITTIAGTGAGGFNGDAGPASAAVLGTPLGVAIGSSGDIFVTGSTARVRRISGGQINTVAGNGSFGFNGDGVNATLLQLSTPVGLAVDPAGNLLIADQGSNRLRKVSATGAISTVAGNGGVFSVGDNGAAASARLYNPSGIAVDGAGNLVIADSRNNRLRKVAPNGTITTIAGTGSTSITGDGGSAASAGIGFIADVALDAAGNIYIAGNNRVRKIATAGNISTIVGTGTASSTGDGGLATLATINNPQGVAVDVAGNVFIAEFNGNRVRKISAADGTISTFAGTGTSGTLGDGGQADAAQLASPTKLAFDAAGNLYIDVSNGRVRKVAPDKTISLFSTSGAAAVATGAGSVFVASPSQVFRVFPDGTSTVIAGLASGISGDNGPALMASLNVSGLAVMPDGAVLFADSADNVIRKLTPVAAGTAALSASPAGIFARRGSASAGNNLAIALNGDGAFTWSATTSVTTPVGGAWLTLSASSGTGSQSITVTSNPSGLAPGDYNGSVTITSPQAVNPSLTIPVTMTVLPPLLATIPASISLTNSVGGTSLFVSNGGSGGVIAFTTAASVTTPPGGSWLLVSPSSANTSSNVSVSFDTTGLPIGVFTGSITLTATGVFNSPLIVPVTLTVNPGAAPTLSSIAPTSGNQSTTANVTLTGTNFFPGATTVTIAGSGVTASAVSVATGGTSLTAAFAIGASTATGTRNVTVTTAQGTSGPVSFTVNPGVPSLTSISPSSANPGQALGVTILGTNFITAATSLSVAGLGISLSDVNVTSNSSLTATLTIDANAAVSAGAHAVTVTTAAGTSNSVTFTVNSPPTLTSIAPSTGLRGQALSVTILGTSFIPSATTISITGAGVSLTSITNLTSATQRNVTLIIDPTAPAGARSVSVTTAAGSSNALTFTVNPSEGYTISTVVGQGAPTEGGMAAAQTLPPINDVARDSQGNLYLAASAAHRVYKVTPAGTISTFAGTGFNGGTGDGGAATAAQLGFPRGVVVDAGGNVYIATPLAIRKVNTAGIISTVAGTGTFPGATVADGGLATLEPIIANGLAIDSAGNLYFADNSRVRKVTTSGIITTIAGNGTNNGFNGDNQPATSASLFLDTGSDPFSLTRKFAVDAAGNLYIPDSGNRRIRKVDTAGTITTIAGTGECCFSGDGGAATEAQLSFPEAVAIDGAGNIFISDTGGFRIRKISGGLITTIAGNGSFGFDGDGANAGSRRVTPLGLILEPTGNLLFADVVSNRVRRLSPAGDLTTVAGNSGISSGDNGPATSAQLFLENGIATDGAGNLFIADTLNSRIKKVATNGTLTTIAGNGSFATNGDGGPATAAAVGIPLDVAADNAGNVYFVGDNRVRRIAANGVISTVAGTGEAGFSGDGGQATAALLNNPQNVAVDATGRLYISDSNNLRIRRVDFGDGTIVTIAGNGSRGSDGDGGAATAAQLNDPSKIAVDSTGKLYIVEDDSNRLRQVAADGTISTLLSGALPFLQSLRAVAAGSGGVFVSVGSQILRVFPDGTTTAIAGNSSQGISGDGGAALMAGIDASSIATGPNGSLFIADSSENVVRKLTPVADGSAAVSTATGLRFRVGALPASANLNLALNGNGVFTWTATANVATPVGGSWLTLSQNSGTGGMIISVTANPSGLAPGDFNGSVTIASPQAVGGSLTIPVTLTVLPPVLSSSTTSISRTAVVGGANPGTQFITLSNSGSGGSLAFTAAASVITPAGGNWLVVTPTSGNTTGNPSVLFSVAGLPAGSFTGSVTLTAAAAANPPIVIPVTLNVAPSAPPTLSSIAPASGRQGQTVNVTLTGTNFAPGATTIAVAGGGVSPSAVAVTSATTLTATFGIASNATVGARNVTVTTASGTSGAVTFTVNLPSAPTLSALSPGSFPLGQIMNVTLTGTNFISGATTAAVTGLGVAAIDVGVVSTTSLEVLLLIASDAAAGTRNITVTTPGGTSNPFAFTLNGPAVTPSISDLTASPPGVTQAAAPYFGKGFTVTVNGQNFQSGVVASLGTVNLPTVFVSAAQLTVDVTASALSAPGIKDLKVTNPGGLVSNTVSVRVIERGDTNGNRSVNIGDALVCALTTGGINKPPLAVSVGDLNLNGSVNIGDCLVLALFAGGVNPNFNTPTVTVVSPSSAVAGGALTITGTGLAPGTTTSSTMISFTTTGDGITRVVPTSASPTSVTVTVPNDAVTGPMQVYRTDTPLGGAEFPLSAGSGSALMLTNVSPFFAVTPGTSLTLTGMGFSTTASSNTVTFAASSGTVNGTVTAATASSLTVAVPAGAVCGSVTVTVAGQTTNARMVTVSGTSCGVQLIDIWGGGSPGEIVVLEGVGFNVGTPANNVVRFAAAGGGTVEAPVVAAGRTQLHVKIPDTAAEGNVTVQVGTTTSNGFLYRPPSAMTPSSVNVMVDSTNAFGSYQTTINFNKNVVSVSASNVRGGTCTSFTGAPSTINIDNTAGTLTINHFVTGNFPVGQCSVANITFTPVAVGTSNLTLSGVTLTDAAGNDLPSNRVSLSSGSVTVLRVP